MVKIQIRLSLPVSSGESCLNEKDKAYVTFLTPYGNTLGFTVVVPRKHLDSDIFGLEDKKFNSILEATYKALTT